MLIRVSGSSAVLEDPLLFDAFKVVGEADADLSALGRVEESDHVFVEQEVVRSLAGDVAARPEWEDGFAAMVSYAEAHGWVDDGGRIRAHVERPS